MNSKFILILFTHVPFYFRSFVVEQKTLLHKDWSGIDDKVKQRIPPMWRGLAATQIAGCWPLICVFWRVAGERFL